MIRHVTEGEADSTASETVVKAVKRPGGVNPLVGGLGRYFCLLSLERALQLLLFPLVLRSVHDSFACDAPLPAQTLAAGAAVGAAVSVVKYPLDKAYMRKV